MNYIDIYQNWIEAKELLVKRDDILEPIRKFTKLAAEDYTLLDNYSYKYPDKEQQRQRNFLETECNIQHLGTGNNRVIFGVGRAENIPTLKIDGEEIYLALKCFLPLGDWYDVRNKKRHIWPMYVAEEDIKKDRHPPKPGWVSSNEILAFEKYVSKIVSGRDCLKNVPRLQGIICSNGIILHLQEDLTKGNKLRFEEPHDYESGYILGKEYIFDFKDKALDEALRRNVDSRKYWDSKLIL